MMQGEQGEAGHEDPRGGNLLKLEGAEHLPLLHVLRL